MSGNIELEVIDTTEQISNLVDQITIMHLGWIYEPALYIDLEGVNLCREGTISIFSLAIDRGYHSKPRLSIKLIDVYTLGRLAFDTAGVRPKSLKMILEDADIPKVFFDVRNDSDALFAHYGIGMQGIEDVQLMESMTRKNTAARRFLNGLNKCIGDVELEGVDRTKWRLAKNAGERLYKAERGGSYEVFNQRPVPQAILNYCAGDVQCLPSLYRKYRDATARWKNLVKEASQQRVTDSQQPEYQHHGQHRALAPWTAEQNQLLDVWHCTPSRGYFDSVMDWNRPDYEDDWDSYQECGNDIDDWTRCPWQGPPS